MVAGDLDQDSLDQAVVVHVPGILAPVVVRVLSRRVALLSRVEVARDRQRNL